MTNDPDTMLEHQADASEHDVFEELPAEATEAIEAAIEPPDNRFIPVRSEDLLERILQDDAVRIDRDALTRVYEGMRDVVEQETRAFERAVMRCYHPFCPDADTTPLDEQDPEREQELLDRVSYILEKANYERLSQTQLEDAIRTANTHGLRVDIDQDAVRHMEAFVRGRGTIQKRFRSARAPIRGRPRQIEVFKRLAIVISFHEDDRVIFKLFRDIPLADMEALLPHARVSMSTFDRLKVFGGGAGALGGVATKLLSGAVLSWSFLWVAVLGFFGLGMKSFFGYRNTMRHRMGQRTQHLYYQNLANNMGVLTTLLMHVCEEELKEALLSYAFLVDAPVGSQREIDERIETWLRERCDVDINFDCPDGLETLDRFDLWEDRAAWRVADPERGAEVLATHWCSKRSVSYHEDAFSTAS